MAIRVTGSRSTRAMNVNARVAYAVFLCAFPVVLRYRDNTETSVNSPNNSPKLVEGYDHQLAFTFGFGVGIA